MLRRLRHRRLERRRLQAVQHARGPLRDLLATDLPDPRGDWRKSELLVLDIETTGLDANNDHLIAIGWVPVRDGRIVIGEAQRLIVATPQPVADSATVHGLRDQDVASGCPLDDALAALYAALAGKTLVVHYAGLDKAMLDRLSRERFGAPLHVAVIDTLMLAQRALRHTTTGQGDFRLAALRQRYGLPPVGQHDALSDAYATAELLLVLASRLGSGDGKCMLGDLLTG